MRIALIAPPFLPVPPERYGGTELFIAHLACGLKRNGLDVVVYTNGEATVDVEKRWIYEHKDWPIQGEVFQHLKDINHSAWAIDDAASDCDVIHLNNAPGLTLTRFVNLPFVYTVHHQHLAALSEFYSHYPDVNYVTISDFQRTREPLRTVRTIHHGVDVSHYELQTRKQPYLSFLGRFAPEKGAHLAIEVSKKSGVPLKLAGQVQPMFREYFEREIKPHIDGRTIEFVGELDLAGKNELLGNSMAMLFPIQWDEPFGLVMIEAMACGTPVLALPGGSVREVVADGVSGQVCLSVNDMVAHLTRIDEIPPATIREYAVERFSLETMVSNYIQLYRDIAEGEPANSTPARVAA